MPRERSTSDQDGLQPGAPLSLSRGLRVLVYMLAIRAQLCSSDGSPTPQTWLMKVPEEFTPWCQAAGEETGGKTELSPAAGDSWMGVLGVQQKGRGSPGPWFLLKAMDVGRSLWDSHGCNLVGRSPSPRSPDLSSGTASCCGYRKAGVWLSSSRWGLCSGLAVTGYIQKTA